MIAPLTNMIGIAGRWAQYAPFILALLAVGFIKFGKKSKRSGVDPTDNELYHIHMDDMKTEANGPQDWAASHGLATVYNQPILWGATLGRGGTSLSFARDLSKKLGGKRLVFEGARKRGYNQGLSPLASEIVKWAEAKPKLTLTIGGKWTDLAIALKHKPSIASKLRVIGVGGSNVTDPEGVRELAFIKSKVRNITVLGRNEYGVLIKRMRGNEWLKKHIGQLAASDMILKPTWLAEARKNNIGQFGADTSFRIADSIPIMMAFEGAGMLKDTSKMLNRLEKGLGNLKKG